MIIKSEKCLFAPIECNNVEGCKYMLHRFGVLECEPIGYKKTLVNVIHKKELKEREELFKNTTVKSGDNYNKKLDLSYKDAVISKEEKRKREY